jgi:hypothetical protein
MNSPLRVTVDDDVIRRDVDSVEIRTTYPELVERHMMGHTQKDVRRRNAFCRMLDAKAYEDIKEVYPNLTPPNFEVRQSAGFLCTQITD